MGQKFDRPLCSLDLETTGTRIDSDRIIEIGIVRFKESKAIRYRRLFNPGIPIPPEATAVHGYTDADVKDCPPLSDHAAEIMAFLEGCDLLGFRIINFDIPMLGIELDRAGIEWDISAVRIFDAYRIFALKEPRDLTAAMRFYCNSDRPEVHRADEDAYLAARVFRAQIQRYPDLDSMSPDAIAEFCKYEGESRLDFAGKLALNADGEPVFNFGKYKGRRIADEIDYARWMLKADFPRDTKRILRRVTDEHYRQKAIARKRQKEPCEAPLPEPPPGVAHE